MKFSWERIFTFGQYVAGFTGNQQMIPGWLDNHPEETKFRNAVQRVLEQIGEVQKVFQQKKADVEMDHCATMHARAGDPDSPKIIVRSEKGELCFTIEGDKARKKAVDELIAKVDLEIEPVFVNELPKLNAVEIEIFKGFVLSDEQVEALKEKKETVSGNGHIPESELRETATSS